MSPDGANDVDIDISVGDSVLEGRIDGGSPPSRDSVWLLFVHDDVEDRFAPTFYDEGTYRFDDLPEGEAELVVYEIDSGNFHCWRTPVVILPRAVIRQDVRCHEIEE